MPELYSSVRLKPKEDRRIKGGHLWIYSNEIDTTATPLKNFSPGQLVQIENHQGEFLGIGYINPNTLLCARLLSRNPKQIIDTDFFIERLQQALTLRQQIFTQPFYRLAFAESDFIPGLIVDRYNDILVVQMTTAGIEQLQSEIIHALKSLINPKAILLRNDSGARKLEGLENYVKFAFGDAPDLIPLTENHCQFMAPIITGQKTGWWGPSAATAGAAAR